MFCELSSLVFESSSLQFLFSPPHACFVSFATPFAWAGSWPFDAAGVEGLVDGFATECSCPDAAVDFSWNPGWVGPFLLEGLADEVLERVEEFGVYTEYDSYKGYATDVG